MSQTKVKSGLLNFPDQTDFVKLPSGTTAQRPSSPEKGYSRYNTTDNKLEFWTGTIWQQLPGVVAPIITSISYPGDDLAADPDGGQTITINGGDFKAGATVTVDGTTPSVITFVSATEITFTAPAKAAGDYNIVVTNVDGGNATAVDGMTYNGLPSWTTPAGNLGTFVAGSTIPTITLVATEPDSGVVSYSVTTGALPTGLALTGADIDGTVPTPAGQTTYNFSVTASDDENQSTERAFNIVVYLQVTNTVDEVDPFGDSSGVMLYKLDGDATDESGNYNGVASNVTWGGSGVFATSASFNGSNSVISVSKPVFLSGNPTFSVSMWIKPTNTNVFFQLGSEAIDQSFHAYTDFGALNNLRIGVWGTDYLVLLNGKMNNYLNTWFNITLTHDGSVTRGYINGALDNSASRTLSISSNNTMSIGSSVTVGYPWAGSIDQTRIFNKALTPLEVESLYQERTVICGGQADTLDILGDNSCVATYQLNGNANDLSGNYSGTAASVSYELGEFGLAAVFTGSSASTDSRISFSNDVYGSSTTVFSASLWVKCTNTTGEIPLIGNGSTVGGTTGYVVYINSGSLVLSFANGSNYDFFYGQSINDNNWHHIAITYNNGAYVLYLDGSVELNGTSSIFLNNATPTYDTFLGNRWARTQDTTNSVLNGSIDQVRIFDKALNSTEVTTLYNETACDALACSGTTNTLDILSDGSCIAAYPLDGSPADLSGNNNHGLMVGSGTFRSGKFDLCYSKNNTSAIVCGSFGISGTAANFSGSMWVKFDDFSAGSIFIMLTGSNTNNSTYALGVSASGNILIDAYGLAYFFNNTPIFENQWYHIVGVSSGSNHQLYINGVLSGTINQSLNFVDNFRCIGGRSIDNSTLYPDSLMGSIDQVRVFNKALSAGEVATLYNETACN